MKKLALATVLATLSTGSFAASDAGCGIGTMIFEGKEGIGPNILAATTNGTSGNQTFGMTSGTSECESAFASYIEANQETLAKEMARGEGETLVGLLNAMGCEDTASASHSLKSNYNNIFPTADVNASVVSDRSGLEIAAVVAFEYDSYSGISVGEIVYWL